MAEYTMDDAREEAFDLIEHHLESKQNHYETGNAACEALADVILANHIMPMDRELALGFAAQYLRDHADVVDLSQQSQA